MVLIIEPSNELAAIIKKALQRENISATIAHTAAQAIKKADQENLDAVIVELAMPRHNGLEFIYEFRSYSDWQDKPVIVYSQISAEESGLNNYLKKEMGLSAYLYKPTTSLEKLVSEVQRAIPDEIHKR